MNNSAFSYINEKTEFVSNDYQSGRKVISVIESELRKCNEFSISVAFITLSGITPLLQTLKELEEKGIKGRILTTNYLNFSEPKAIKKLAALSNVQMKMYDTEKSKEGFHTKGYIFKKDGSYNIIVGSSNLTLNALTRNKEWNAKIVSGEGEVYSNEIITEFEELWNSPFSLDYSTFIDNYETKYEIIRQQKREALKETPVSLPKYTLSPNSMQTEFVKNIKSLKSNNQSRALLISATGTGKTYASAFALRELNAKKVLFLVHREQIAKQAIKSFKKVLDNNLSFGLLSGNSKNFDSDYLFSTMQMMSKDEVKIKFDKDAFDIIVIDEVHRVGSNSYKKIMDYFTPNFWIGMTASPDRTDGFDIYGLFHNNIAQEIRLEQALENDLLCPFHYFGITDLDIEGYTPKHDNRDFNKLTSDVRTDLILEKAQYFGYSGDRVKGLIFCSGKDEAKELSNKFNARGLRTEFICGETNQEKREDAIERLVGEKTDEYLDYIFTVDIFNEGVDIPEVNQVIMLRPTESAIVFIQQLGRGLRKSDDKEFVVILDFIGNYQNNFLIPLALSGDRTYNRDSVRKYVMEGNKTIPGSSTIHFDEITKERIYSSIDNMSVDKRLMVEKYYAVKNKLGRVPSLCELDSYGDIESIRLFEKFNSYHEFLVYSKDLDYKVQYSDVKIEILNFLSLLFTDGKRMNEIVILLLLINLGIAEKDTYKSEIEKYTTYNESGYKSAVNILQKNFFGDTECKKYSNVDLLYINNNKIYISKLFKECLKDVTFKKCVVDTLNLGINNFINKYINQDENGLSLYSKYTRKDICRILNWQKDESSVIYGYKVKNNYCPIFVTYNKKSEDFAETTLYKDQFIDDKAFEWYTKNRVTLESDIVKQFAGRNETGLKLLFFVKKSNDEGKDFYYLGEVIPQDPVQKTMQDKEGKELPVVQYKLLFGNPVRQDLFDYLIS